MASCASKEAFLDLISRVSQSMGSAWASGLNVYATCAVLGLVGRFDVVELNGGLSVLESWWVIGPALALYCVEFVADKVPGVDSAWDVIHTFVRVPLGALLAASAFSDEGAATQGAALVSGVSLAAQSHVLKASLRTVINATPEPVSNWIASLSEDLLVVAGIFFAVSQPGWFLMLLGVFVVAGAIGIYFTWRIIRAAGDGVASVFGGRPSRRTEGPSH